MIKTLKIRLLPTPEQEQAMWKHIGCSRWIYNYMLDLQQKRYEAGEKHLSAFDTIKLLTPLKKQEEYPWLNEVSNSTLQRTCQDLNVAYDRFFKKISQQPKFKSRKKSRKSFPTCDVFGKTYFKDGFVNLQKIGKVAYKSTYIIPQGNTQKFSNPRVQYINNKWILTVGVECENQAPTEHSGRIGIDLGVKELAVVAFDGQQLVFHNINKSKRVRTLKHKLKHLQRNVSRKYRTNGNYDKSKAIEKYERMIAEIHYKLSNIRRNYTHQTTHYLASLNPTQITMEDLNVAGMMKTGIFQRQSQSRRSTSSYVKCTTSVTGTTLSSLKWEDFTPQVKPVLTVAVSRKTSNSRIEHSFVPSVASQSTATTTPQSIL